MRGNVISMAAWKERRRWRLWRAAEIVVPARQTRGGRKIIRLRDVRRELEALLGRRIGA